MLKTDSKEASYDASYEAPLTRKIGLKSGGTISSLDMSQNKVFICNRCVITLDHFTLVQSAAHLSVGPNCAFSQLNLKTANSKFTFYVNDVVYMTHPSSTTLGGT